MKIKYCLMAAALSTAIAPAWGTSGTLGTLPLGDYVCSKPGDAGGAAWIELPGRSFTIGNGSTYRSADGAGTYLLAGKNVTFTRGPIKGMRFERTGNAALQVFDEDGKLGRVRCIRELSRR